MVFAQFFFVFAYFQVLKDQLKTSWERDNLTLYWGLCPHFNFEKRQVVEGVISQIKLFNAGSGGRTLTCVLVYVYAYAIGYSYYRRGELED